MKIWLTLPYDDEGVVEGSMGATDQFGWTPYWSPVAGAVRAYGWRNMEGIWWHRRKKDAIAKAIEYRNERIARAHAEYAKLLTLPAITAQT